MKTIVFVIGAILICSQTQLTTATSTNRKHHHHHHNVKEESLTQLSSKFIDGDDAVETDAAAMYAESQSAPNQESDAKKEVKVTHPKKEEEVKPKFEIETSTFGEEEKKEE